MRALVVEDDVQLAGYMKDLLRRDGFAVDIAHTGGEGLSLSRENPYDVILLDVMLKGGIDGFSLCRTMRDEGFRQGIIMVTAKSTESDILEGFDHGADDYVTKPFQYSILSARIRAILKRINQLAGDGNNALRTGDITLNLLTRRVTRKGKPIALSRKEFEVLEYFMRNPRRTLSSTTIAQHVWDRDFESTSNIVQVQINHLREKINSGFKPAYIHTVRGFGYCFEEP
jgi:DNA-binding response OmpR family regulator